MGLFMYLFTLLSSTKHRGPERIPGDGLGFQGLPTQPYPLPVRRAALHNKPLCNSAECRPYEKADVSEGGRRKETASEIPTFIKMRTSLQKYLFHRLLPGFHSSGAARGRTVENGDKISTEQTFTCTHPHWLGSHRVRKLRYKKNKC